MSFSFFLSSFLVAEAAAYEPAVFAFSGLQNTSILDKNPV
jgi:hypothetical protein